MTARARHVCFTPNSGHQPTANECPVCARSGHRMSAPVQPDGARHNLALRDRIETLPGPAAIALGPETTIEVRQQGLLWRQAGHDRLMSLWGYAVHGSPNWGMPGSGGTLEGEAVAGDRCSYVRL
jgi:hypothetical protein